MRLLKNIQWTLGLLAFFGIILIIKKIASPTETTACIILDAAFKAQIFLFLTSIVLSIIIFKKEKNSRNPLLVVPLLFCIAFVILFTSYKMRYITIYEEEIGPNFVKHYTEKPECNRTLLKILTK